MLPSWCLVKGYKGVVKMRSDSKRIKNLKNRPIIVGSGPAGLFCGYILAQNGYDPLYICENEILRYIITFDDFSKDEINKSLNDVWWKTAV